MKLSLTVINKTFMEWGKNHQQQSLGQYLMNKLAPKETSPEIFYEEDVNKAYRLFVKKFT